MKRILTQKEIKDIINYVVVSNKYIPKEISDSITNKTKENFRKQLQKIRIYPEKISELKTNLKKIYLKSLIQPGESVGIIMAQSVGERQTQLTLNSFHSAGLAIKTVVSGVPRFSELLNATKNPKLVSCNVYFKEKNDTIKKLRKNINHGIVELKLSDIYTSKIINTKKIEKPWYKYFRILVNDNFDIYDNFITYKLKKDILCKYNLSIQTIAKQIENIYSDVYCVYSPLSEKELDIYINTTDIKLPDEKILFIDNKNTNLIYIEEVVIPNLDKIQICGITNITNIFFKIEPNNLNKWMVETEGSNLSELLKNPIVDNTQTISNNIWDIYAIFGIEACREFLIEEFLNVVSSDGTYINPSHIQLLVDIMTYSGTILSISRYGMKLEQTGPIAKASFEESLDNFLNAGFYGIKDNTNGISASILCGKNSNIGTGMCELRIDFDKLI